MRPQTPPTVGLGAVGKFINLLSEIAGYMSVTAIAAAMLVITYEVLARYLFRWPTVWEIEAAVFLLIFSTFVGSTYTLKYGGHISMDMVSQKLKPRSRAYLEVVTSLASLVFCIFVTVKGWEMWWEAYLQGWASDSIWAPPLWIPYLFLPVGFTCMCLQFVALIAGKLAIIRSGG
jgi:TRAP-type C4-dicarboxylate transport system permease small subunit